VRELKLDFLDDDVTVRPQELAMAESYISALSGDFEPGEFSDNYRQALEQVIEAKVAGHEVKAPDELPRSSGQVVDLMDALRRSVAEAKSRRGEGTGDSTGDSATTAAPAKSATKKSAAKKAAKTAKPAAKKAATTKKAAKKAAAKKSASRRTA
jgi:DNA end-binding protein Ku